MPHKMCHVSRVTRHTSHVTRHTSHVTRHTSPPSARHTVQQAAAGRGWTTDAAATCKKTKCYTFAVHSPTVSPTCSACVLRSQTARCPAAASCRRCASPRRGVPPGKWRWAAAAAAATLRQRISALAFETRAKIRRPARARAPLFRSAAVETQLF